MAISRTEEKSNKRQLVTKQGPLINGSAEAEWFKLIQNHLQTHFATKPYTMLLAASGHPDGIGELTHCLHFYSFYKNLFQTLPNVKLQGLYLLPEKQLEKTNFLLNDIFQPSEVYWFDEQENAFDTAQAEKARFIIFVTNWAMREKKDFIKSIEYYGEENKKAITAYFKSYNHLLNVSRADTPDISTLFSYASSTACIQSITELGIKNNVCWYGNNVMTDAVTMGVDEDNVGIRILYRLKRECERVNSHQDKVDLLMRESETSSLNQLVIDAADDGNDDETDRRVFFDNFFKNKAVVTGYLQEENYILLGIFTALGMSEKRDITVFIIGNVSPFNNLEDISEEMRNKIGFFSEILSFANVGTCIINDNELKISEAPRTVIIKTCENISENDKEKLMAIADIVAGSGDSSYSEVFSAGRFPFLQPRPWKQPFFKGILKSIHKNYPSFSHLKKYIQLLTGFKFETSDSKEATAETSLLIQENMMEYIDFIKQNYAVISREYKDYRNFVLTNHDLQVEQKNIMTRALMHSILAKGAEEELLALHVLVPSWSTGKGNLLFYAAQLVNDSSALYWLYQKNKKQFLNLLTKQHPVLKTPKSYQVSENLTPMKILILKGNFQFLFNLMLELKRKAIPESVRSDLLKFTQSHHVFKAANNDERPIAILLNHVHGDGIGDIIILIKHYQQIAEQHPSYRLIPVISCHRNKYEEVMKMLAELKWQDYFVFREEEQIYKNNELRDCLKKSVKIFLISHIKFPMLEELEYLFPDIKLKYIGEHEKVLKFCHPNVNFSREWEDYTLGLSTKQGIMLKREGEKISQTEFLSSVMTNDRVFGEALLNVLPKSEPFTIVAAYFNLIDSFLNFIRFLHLSEKNEKPVFIYFSGFEMSFWIINKLKNTLSPHNIGKITIIDPELGHHVVIENAKGRQIYLFCGFKISNKSYNALYRFIHFAGVSGDNSFEKAICNDVLPFYVSTNNEGLKQLCIISLVHIIGTCSLPKKILYDFTKYFQAVKVVNSVSADERDEAWEKLESINLSELIEYWPVVTKKLFEDHNFYDKLDAVFLKDSPHLNDGNANVLEEKKSSLPANIISLCFAAAHGDKDTVIRLLNEKPSLATEKLRNGATPLLVAVKHEQICIVEIFIKTKVDPNAVCKVVSYPARETTALTTAIYNGRVDIVKLLLKHPDIKDVHYNSQNPVNSPLSLAIYLNKKNIIAALLESGKTDNINFDVEEKTPLHAAIIFNNKYALRLLIKNKKVQLNNISSRGFTALYLAIAVQNVYAVKALISAGCDTDKKITDDETVISYLQLAVQSKNKAIIALLQPSSIIKLRSKFKSEHPEIKSTGQLLAVMPKKEEVLQQELVMSKDNKNIKRFKISKPEIFFDLLQRCNYRGGNTKEIIKQYPNKPIYHIACENIDELTKQDPDFIRDLAKCLGIAEECLRFSFVKDEPTTSQMTPTPVNTTMTNKRMA